MTSREKILSVVKQNQPAAVDLPAIINYDQHYENLVEKFTTVLSFIGGQAHLVNSYEEIAAIVQEGYGDAKRVITTCVELSEIAELNVVFDNPHELADVDLFITTANLAVAENAAVWIGDEQLPARVLPFISQQLAVIINEQNIVATMHDAYDVIADKDYGYAAFIAGPSKTADIAQSLVLGAHGPKTMNVFIFRTS